MKIKSNNDYQGMYDSFFVCKCVKLKWYETLLKYLTVLRSLVLEAVEVYTSYAIL
jgi:hypothetical protein